jgi:hypothetical protein
MRFPPLLRKPLDVLSWLRYQEISSRYPSRHVFISLPSYKPSSQHNKDEIMTQRKGSRQRILEFLLANIGRVIEGDEIREASGNVSEWARRVRELRDEEGYQILTHRDRRDLKPGQYLLETPRRLPASPARFPKRHALTCWNATAIHARCVASLLVILIHLIQVERCGSQWVISLINRRVGAIHPTICGRFAIITMKGYKILPRPNQTVSTY